MDYNQKQCPHCGAMNPAQSIACQSCGRQFVPSAAQAPPPPPQASQPMPPVQPQYGGQGYGAPPPPAYPGANAGVGGAYPAGNYGGYPGGAQPPPPAAPEKPKKKKKKGCLIAVIVAAVLLVGGALGIYFALQSTGSGVQIVDDYATLETYICNSKTPQGVAAKEGRLAEFDKDHPGEVEDDLQALMDACVDYMQGDPADPARYSDALTAIEELESSSVSAVSKCAKRVYSAIDEEYTASGLVAPPADVPAVDVPVPPNSDSSVSGPPASDSTASGPPPQSGSAAAPTDESDSLPLEVPTIVGTVDPAAGQYTYGVQNHSGKEIVWYEFMVFCYDANGNKIVGNDGTNWEWGYGEDRIPAGGSIAEADMGYWPLSNCPNAQLIIPVCSYVEYADGTSWGVTSSDFSVTEDVESWSIILGIYADAMAAVVAPGA